jgi:AcrR family transcriptional regulator
VPVTSLRDLADELGTSARMLVYYFSTKEQLVQEAIIEARRRQRSLFDEALRHRPDEDYADTLLAAWNVMAGPDGRGYMRLFVLVHAVPGQQAPWGGFPVIAVHDWLPILEAGLRAAGYPDPATLATVVFGVSRGLLLDERATDEQDLITEAFRVFLDMMRHYRDR